MSNRSVNKQKLKELASIFPEAFVDETLDFDRLDKLLGREESFGLEWSGKREAHRRVAQDEGEPFTISLKREADSPNPQHFFVVGDNLKVMRCLRRAYAGQIKCIYVDPPYNTGKEFVYRDVRSKESGLSTTSKATRHSAWLSMIYPRLCLAQELLREDGVIFISIDEHEYANLRVVCDELFGEANCVGNFIWRRSGGGGLRGVFPVTVHEYILCYAKNARAHTERWFAPYSPQSLSQFRHLDEKGRYKRQALYLSTLSSGKNQKYYIDLPDGSKARPPEGRGAWRFIEETFLREKEKGCICFVPSKNSPLICSDGRQAAYNIYTKQYIDARGSNPTSILPDAIVGQTRAARAEIKSLLGRDVFDYAKPVSLLKYLFSLFPKESGDIFLDMFAGSAAASTAVLCLNESGEEYRFLAIQIPEPCNPRSTAYRTGFQTIDQIGVERINRYIENSGYDHAYAVCHLRKGVLHFTETDGFRVRSHSEKNATTDIDALRTEIQLHFGFALDSAVSRVPIETKNCVERIESSSQKRALFLSFDDEIDVDTLRTLPMRETDLFVCWKEAFPEHERDSIRAGRLIYIQR
ncbi:MAG: site-specific DNA-methyltransferase [Myxococcota bacterium]|nr:site-specific DNA-methyltransferase [Myxococcota bacterium]